MDPLASSEENIPRGCLKLNNKIYPVYEGLNTIGRNPEAVINIKNLNISQQHAVITVVDENSHYISDFKSSNGTVLNNTKLKPLKLYKLLNGASIKFADIFCTYKKLDSSEHVTNNFEETQNFSETFYEANTQAIHLPHSDELIINEMPTQVMDSAMLNYSQMSTQVMESKSLSINEMPTQVFNYNNASTSNVRDDADDNSSSDSLDFITMQKATQSQGFALNNSDSDAEEPSPILPVKLNSKKNIPTSDSEGLQSTPEIIPVKLNSSKAILSSDSEGTQSALNTKSNSTVPEEEEGSCSQICPVRTSTKNLIESDSDSDTEEYMPLRERRRSRYVISDDDETDIEDADKAETTMNDTDIIPNTQEAPQKPASVKSSQKLEQSSMDSFRLELSERIDENGEEMKENSLSSITQDHVYCQEPKTSSSKSSEDLVTKNLVSEDHIYCRSAEASQNLDLENKDDEEAATNTVENAEQVTKSSAEEMQARGDEIPHQTSSELISNDQSLEERKKNDGETVQNDEKGAGEGSHLQNTVELVGENSKKEEKGADIFDQPTQQLGLNFVDDETQSVVGDEEAGHDSELTEELTVSADQKLEEQQKKEKDQDLEVKKSDEETVKNNEKAAGERLEVENNRENAKEEEKMAEDIFDQPTQQLPLDFIEDDTLSIVGDHDSKLTEELAVPSDQKSEEQKDEVKIRESDSESKNKDDIFAQPTQQIDLDFVEDKDKVDIYLQPTQKLTTSEEQSKSDLEDDFYIQATQPINRDVPSTSKSTESRMSDDFYLLPTQKLINNIDNNLEIEKKVDEDKNKDETNLAGAKEHEFARPFEFFGSPKKSMPKNDDDLILPPTQALEYLHKEDEATTSKQSDVSEHNSNSKEVEDQLEMLFYSQSDHKFVATQQLVDVLEDKNDNEDIIEDSMIEENDISKSKDAKFSTVDSIRMILDDDLEADDRRKESNQDQTETKTTDLESAANQDKRTRKRKLLPKENSTNQEEKKEDVKKDKGTRKEKTEELKEDTIEHTFEKDGGRQLEVTRARTRSKKNDDQGTVLSEDTSNDRVEEKNVNQTENVKKDKRTRRGKEEELKENNIDHTNGKDAEKEPESSGQGRPTRKGARGKKDKSDDQAESTVNVKEINVDKSQEVEKYERVRNERTKEFKENNIELNEKDAEKEPESSGQGRPTRKGARGKKDSEISKDKNDDKAEGTVNIEEINVNKSQDVRKYERVRKEKTNNIEQPKDDQVRPTRRTTRGRKDDYTGSEISEDGNNRADTPVDTEEKNVKQTKNTEDVEKDKHQIKQKTAKIDEAVEKKEGKESETDVKVKPVRSSKRGTKDNDKDSESSDTKSTVSAADVSEEQESNTKNRGKRKIDKELNQTNQNPAETTGSVTRKRNLKTTAVDSGDEFEPKISKVVSPKRTPAKQKNKNIEPVVRPETPTIRTSARNRKLKLDEDEVISVASSSSVANEVVTISSSSSVSEEPVKKSRRLSANSRAQRNEEEKEKNKQEVKGRGRKASVQQSPSVVPATPERSKRQLKPKVVFTMMDNPELESLIRQLGGSVVDTVDACTVLVTVNVKRSLKLLCAVGQAKPICSPQWLHACKKSFSFLDPWDYILVDEEAEKKWNFSLRESLNRSAKTKLLKNYTFQLIVNSAADVLKGAIEACGGTCVTRNLAKVDSENKIIVSSSDNKNKFSKIVKQDPTIKVVEAEAIFDGTLRQEFRFNKHLLT